MRSEDEDGLTELFLLPELDGLLYLFWALETLSSADTRGVVVPNPLLEGRVLLEGRALLDGLSARSVLSTLDALDGLDVEDGFNPADEGLPLLPATCIPLCPLGLGPVGAG